MLLATPKQYQKSEVIMQCNGTYIFLFDSFSIIIYHDSAKKKTSKVKYRKMISGIINYNTKKKRNLRTIIIVSSLIQKNDDLHKKSPSHTAENTKTQCSDLREKPY